MRPPNSHGHSSETSDTSNNKEINIAVVVACCVVAVAFIVLFLICCSLRGRRKKVHPKNGPRDDKPLLNFCSRDNSLGSSVTYSLGNSDKKDFTSSSNVNSFSIKRGNSLVEEKQSEATEVPPGDTHAKLPLPPGRVAPKPAPPAPAAPKPAPPVPGSVTPATEPATPVPGPATPPPPPNNSAPRAPPPPKIGHPPPNLPKFGTAPKPPLGLHGKGHSSANKETSEAESQKAKLKPFFWDKVLANPEQSMVWNEIKAGSFQFNEEMMENLFGYKKVENCKNERSKRNQQTFEATKYIQMIDPKKAHNLSILLKAINVTTEEVCDAIQEGNELPPDLIETLLKMAPTSQEELKLRLYSEDISKLGPADRFIKNLVEIPFAYKRLEALLFMCSLENETSFIKESLAVLEVACKELKNSRLFLKLLEAVLKTGNRMNDGTFRGGAQAFKLDTLLKLSDVKGVDGKTTLLHFVVLEIIRSEGVRAARRLKESSSMDSVKTEDLLEDSVQETPEHYRSLGLDIVSHLSNELAHVKKAAGVDGDMLTTTVHKLGLSLNHSKEFLNNELSSLEKRCDFCSTLASFVKQAEDDIKWVLEEEKRINALVKSTAHYFHGNPGKDEGMRLFMLVRDFLVMLDNVCEEVKKSEVNPIKIPQKEAPSASTSLEHQKQQQPSPNINEQLFPAIKGLRKDSSSDEES